MSDAQTKAEIERLKIKVDALSQLALLALLTSYGTRRRKSLSDKFFDLDWLP